MSEKLTAWTGCKPPSLSPTNGHFVRVAPFDHEASPVKLFDAVCGPDNAALWRYIPFELPSTAEALGALMRDMAASLDWRCHVLTDLQSGALGMASYMRIRAEHGSAEVGCIIFSRAQQRTPAASEAMFLMAKHLFDDLGYRRFEWKCDNENAASRRAAERLGFAFEGVFRNDMVVKGRSRDTAWFAITDDDWPRVKAGFEAWLAPENFDTDGVQRVSLASCRSSSARSAP